VTFLRRIRRIATNTTVTPIAVSCVLKQIVFSCSNAGTTWTLQIQDKAGKPNILIPALTLTLGGPTIVYFKEAIPMDAGIDIITAGAAPGVVVVWLHCEQAP
jgi:hypothetical protein